MGNAQTQALILIGKDIDKVNKEIVLLEENGKHVSSELRSKLNKLNRFFASTIKVIHEQ